ncbi:MAG: hypothetical protein WBG70_24580 [Spirulinaceae cyanobacterium]
MFEIGNEIESSSKLIRSLVKSRKPENIEAEVVQLTESIQTAKQEYWTLIRSWLDSALPSNINQVVICGGAAQYLETEINDFFSNEAVYWGQDKQEEMLNKFSSQLHNNRTSKNTKNLTYRFTDVYCLADLFTRDKSVIAALQEE